MPALARFIASAGAAATWTCSVVQAMGYKVQDLCVCQTRGHVGYDGITLHILLQFDSTSVIFLTAIRRSPLEYLHSAYENFQNRFRVYKYVFTFSAT